MKLIHGHEKAKAQKIVAKIESGQFDDNDVDSLLMRLRAFCGNHKIFREVANFVAHNDARDRGTTTELLEAFYFNMRYFSEYAAKNTRLDASKPFPLYIKKLIKYQVDKCDAKELLNRFRVGKDRLKARIDSHFKEDKNSSTATLNGKISQETADALSYALGFINANYAFTGKEILDEIVSVIESNRIEFNEAAIRDQADKINICILSLMHNTKFSFSGDKIGSCEISCERPSVLKDARFIGENDQEIPAPVEAIEHGNLHITGEVTVNFNGRDINIIFPVFTANHRTEDWCNQSIFRGEQHTHGNDVTHFQIADFSGEIGINNDFKLYRLDAV